MPMIDPNLPLIDLHRHLDGNVRLETILDLGRRHNLKLPAWDVEGLRPYIQIVDPEPGVMEFIAKFHWMMAVLVDYDACRQVAFENVEDAKNEGIDFLELRFSPLFMAASHGLNPVGVVEAICDGAAAGKREYGLQLNLIGIISRTYGVDSAWQELDALLTQREQIRAFDLAGDEANFPGELFVDHFRRGRDVGWQVTVHAGEIDGPASIWQVVTAVQDPELMDYLAENHIGVESSLTSNFQTSTVPDYASHPLRAFLENGILANINTDDPGISGIDLTHEYQIAAPAAGLSPGQIHQAQRNALEIAFLSPEERRVLLEKKITRK
jgi:adenosine deaminase